MNKSLPWNSSYHSPPPPLDLDFFFLSSSIEKKYEILGTGGKKIQSFAGNNNHDAQQTYPSNIVSLSLLLFFFYIYINIFTWNRNILTKDLRKLFVLSYTSIIVTYLLDTQTINRITRICPPRNYPRIIVTTILILHFKKDQTPPMLEEKTVITIRNFRS